MDDQGTNSDAAGDVLARLLSRAEHGLTNREKRISELEHEISTAKNEVKRLRQVKSVLDGLMVEFNAGHWCEVVCQLDRSKDLWSNLDRFAEGTSLELAAIRKGALDLSEEALGELSSALPAALQEAGLPLDTTSRFPIFKLRNGFFEVRIVKQKREAHIIVRHGHTLKVSADLAHIVGAVRNEDARCFGTTIDLAGFVARLRASYAIVLGADKPRPVALEDVRRSIVEQVPPRDEFAVSLAAVLRNIPSCAEGMNLDHTKSIETGFLLPGFEDRGYFGHISFTTH